MLSSFVALLWWFGFFACSAASRCASVYRSLNRVILCELSRIPDIIEAKDTGMWVQRWCVGTDCPVIVLIVLRGTSPIRDITVVAYTAKQDSLIR